jgi:hypothetical protein
VTRINTEAPGSALHASGTGETSRDVVQGHAWGFCGRRHQRAPSSRVVVLYPAVMASDIPDFEWYSGISSARSLPPRCPFASVERCPGYWQRLSLLGELGSTKLDAKRDEELRRRWEHSQHWPPTAEYATAISGSKDEYSQWKAPLLANFCPETTYDRFGYFASSMSRVRGRS